MRTSLLPILALPLALCLGAGAASACNARKSGAKPIARVRQVSATRWLVCVPGYETVAAAKGAHCAVGLAVPQSGVIASVDAVAMIEESNSASIPQFRFSANATVANELNAQQSGGWTGFLATAAAAVPKGIANMFCFDVTVKSGTSFAQLSSDLQKSWAGSDEADSSGKLLKKHLAVFRLQTIQQETLEHNERPFFNAASANVTTRASANQDDTLFSMQPRAFRNGYGPGTGWTATLQDQNPATSEEIAFGFVRYAGTGLQPDVSSAGSLTRVVFRVFGTASANRALRFTLTTATGVPLPQFSGIRLTLPKPASWPTDGVTVHTQDGSTTKLAASRRQQWTWALQGAQAAAFRAAGTTMHAAGLYGTATQQVFALSNAYGPTRHLFGPESLHPDPSRGDLTGFEVHSDSFQSQTFALTLLSSGYTPKPVPSRFGSILTLPHVLDVVFPMNAQGVGTSIGFPVPPKTKLACQTLLLRFQPVEVVLTDAAIFETQ